MKEINESRKIGNHQFRRKAAKSFREMVREEWGQWEECDIFSQRMRPPESIRQAFKNNRYLVFTTLVHNDFGGPMTRLMIRRHDESGKVTWADKQRIKNELCGEETTAIEFYPSETELFDEANIYHLLVLPDTLAKRLYFQSIPRVDLR